MRGKKSRDEFAHCDSGGCQTDGRSSPAVLCEKEKEQNRDDPYGLLDQLTDCRQSGVLEPEIIAADTAVDSSTWQRIRNDHEQISASFISKK